MWPVGYSTVEPATMKRHFGKMGLLQNLSYIVPKNGIDYIQGSASAVAVNDGDVYVTGYAGGGKYWKNGTEIDLANGYSCYPAAIALSGNDVYISR